MHNDDYTLIFGVVINKTIKKTCNVHSVCTELTESRVSHESLLGHDDIELVRTDLAIFIGVCPFYHFKQLRFRHGLAKLACYPLQVLESNMTCLVIIKEVEYFPNIGSRIL